MGALGLFTGSRPSASRFGRITSSADYLADEVCLSLLSRERLYPCIFITVAVRSFNVQPVAAPSALRRGRCLLKSSKYPAIASTAHRGL